MYKERSPLKFRPSKALIDMVDKNQPELPEDIKQFIETFTQKSIAELNTEDDVQKNLSIMIDETMHSIIREKVKFQVLYNVRIVFNNLKTKNFSKNIIGMIKARLCLDPKKDNAEIYRLLYRELYDHFSRKPFQAKWGEVFSDTTGIRIKLNYKAREMFKIVKINKIDPSKWTTT